MNAREIEIFCTVMRCGTLSAAAEQLHVSQPALSQALRHCEDRLGYRLFHRIGGRLKPTAEANALLPAATELYRKLESFAARAAETGGRHGGILRIGATSSVASSIVPEAIARLRQEMPGVFIVLQMLAMPELETALASGRVDIGIALSPILAPASKTTEVARIPCVVLLRQEHQLAGRARLTLADLAGMPEIGFSHTQDFGRAIAGAFRQACIERNLQVECGSTTTALALVRTGGDFAIVDAFTRDYLPASMAAPLLDPPLLRPMTLVQAPGSGTPALGERFRAILGQLAQARLAAL